MTTRRTPLTFSLGLGLLASFASCKKPPPSEILAPPTQQLGNDPFPPPDTAGAGGSPATTEDGGARGSGGAQGPFVSSGGKPPVIVNDSGVPVPEPDASVPPPPSFTKTALLEAVAACAFVHYEEFDGLASALKDSVTALAASPDEAHLGDAQTAWRNAMASWERLEVFRLGPAAPSTEPGGKDLRDQIYAFPLGNPCKVDQQLVSRAYANPTKFLAPEGVSARGLGGLEYLLFQRSAVNACSTHANINTDGSWAALDEATLAQRRDDYAVAAATDVAARAAELRADWDAGSAFRTEFVTAGAGSGAYALDQEALNAVTNALFYVERETKDWKLGWPLGLVPECINWPEPCPTAVESRFARVSTDDIRQNLRAFRSLFQGCGENATGTGFDDWLEAAGAGGLATRMLTALDGAEQALNALPGPLESTMLTDPAAVRGVHAAVKVLTDLMKSDFVTLLDLELPKTAEGDND